MRKKPTMPVFHVVWKTDNSTFPFAKAEKKTPWKLLCYLLVRGSTTQTEQECKNIFNSSQITFHSELWHDHQICSKENNSHQGSQFLNAVWGAVILKGIMVGIQCSYGIRGMRIVWFSFSNALLRSAPWRSLSRTCLEYTYCDQPYALRLLYIFNIQFIDCIKNCFPGAKISLSSLNSCENIFVFIDFPFW